MAVAIQFRQGKRGDDLDGGHDESSGTLGLCEHTGYRKTGRALDSWSNGDAKDRGDKHGDIWCRTFAMFHARRPKATPSTAFEHNGIRSSTQVE